MTARAAHELHKRLWPVESWRFILPVLIVAAAAIAVASGAVL